MIWAAIPNTASSFPVDDIKRTLDAMSWVKMSTFHWHVVDSQSFPLQVPGFLELSEAGAYAASSVYTPEDVAGIVAYASAVSAAAQKPQTQLMCPFSAESMS